MIISKLQNKLIGNSLLTVPDFNFGQMQRWVGYEPFQYAIEMSISTFFDRFETQFESFRQEEMIENDPNGLEELEIYKAAGWPTLAELFENQHELLKSLIIYHDYDVLHSIIKNENIPPIFYSIQSIDDVQVDETLIKIKGTCFKIERKK